MTQTSTGPLLVSVINGGPAAVKGMPAEQLPALAAEIRGFLVESVARSGGHLGPNLGMVEVTLALHRVFDSPTDVLLFDIGHQAYVHKILTGRAADFKTLRQSGGLSGYLCRAESAHDVIENSHASTALSYADGLTHAWHLTGGMAFEALNNLAAAPHRSVIVLLNDNGRSYAPTVGGIGKHLHQLRTFPVEAQTNLFEVLGLHYVGPIDGHDTLKVERALRYAASIGVTVVVHVITDKGKGYPPAEADDADCLHAVGAVDPATGRPAERPAQTWTDVFADEIAAIGSERRDVVCVTAAMLLPTGLGRFAELHGDRAIDVGIAEPHAVTCAAGLALGGMHPVVAVYSTFTSRAFDQIMMDVALLSLPVTFVLDRAGVTGPDGPSHHGMWDGSLLALIPGLRLACPRDPAQLRHLLREAVDDHSGPTAIRFPKATAGTSIAAERRIGGCDVLRTSRRAQVLLIPVGPMASAALVAANSLVGEGIDVMVVDPRWTAPLDPQLLELAAQHRLAVTIEDSTSTGALGARLAQALAEVNASTLAVTLALPPAFLPHASRDHLLEANGLSASGIATVVRKHLEDLR